MKTIVYFDYCAFIVLIILLISIIARKMTKGRHNLSFLAMLVVALLSVTADIFAVNLDNLGPGNVAAKYISHTAYLFFHILTPFFYAIYVAAQADIWHIIQKNKVNKVLLFGPVILVAAALIVNPFTHIMFYFDENDAYTRSSHFIILYIVTIVYSIMVIYYLIKYRRLFDKKRFAAMFAIIPMLFTAVAIQYFCPWLLVEMFALTCGILFTFSLLQRPEEVVDYETGLGKLSAYVSDIKKSGINSKPIEIILVNITNYGIIRDMLGYDSANAVLREIADNIAAFNRKHMIQAELYYLGQGKFRLVLDERHFARTEESAKMINEMMKNKFSINHMDLNLLYCVCIARFPEDISDVDSLLDFGEELNKVPNMGRVLYAADIYKKNYYDIRKDMDKIIERALIENNFSVYYQPIYSVQEKRFNSAEALLRLIDDKYGFVPPDMFIPAAEKSGAIHKIGKFVLEEVCRFIASEEYEKLNLDYIEVNLSVVQCMSGDLAKQVMDIVKSSGIRPEQINLEITETAASYSQNTLVQNLNELSDAGISFSLDDFGTGYSNMLRIASLPFHIIKLDKSFVDGDSAKLLIMLNNTVKMFKAMNLKIVVEGVETDEMLKRFSDMGCEYIQGYYFSKPLPKAEFVEYIQKSV